MSMMLLPYASSVQFLYGRVEWGKVGRFFGYFFNSLKNLDAMKDFMDYNGQ